MPMSESKNEIASIKVVIIIFISLLSSLPTIILFIVLTINITVRQFRR